MDYFNIHFQTHIKYKLYINIDNKKKTVKEMEKIRRLKATEKIVKQLPFENYKMLTISQAN